jgi:hypothetical protein
VEPLVDPASEIMQRRQTGEEGNNVFTLAVNVWYMYIAYCAKVRGISRKQRYKSSKNAREFFFRSGSAAV